MSVSAAMTLVSNPPIGGRHTLRKTRVRGQVVTMAKRKQSILDLKEGRFVELQLQTESRYNDASQHVWLDN